MNRYIILFFSTFIININFSFAKTEDINISTATNIITNTTADIALKNILTKSIQAISIAKKINKNITLNEVKKIINIEIIPFINTKISTKKSLEKYWHKLNYKQKISLERHIINSLISDYAGILISFNDYDKIKIDVDPKIKTQGNKAIVKVNFSTKEEDKPMIIAAKMVNNESWKIYDIVFSGVSLVKNYSAQFNSYIKRKGFDKFSKKYLSN